MLQHLVQHCDMVHLASLVWDLLFLVCLFRQFNVVGKQWSVLAQVWSNKNTAGTASQTVAGDILLGIFNEGLGE